MAPVIRALQAAPGPTMRVLATAQHGRCSTRCSMRCDRLTSTLTSLAPGQTLPELRPRARCRGWTRCSRGNNPDVALIPEATTTVSDRGAGGVLAGASPYGCVEAGLHCLPAFPAEMNRVVAGRLSRWHSAPTSKARATLCCGAGIRSARCVTGNTVIDALLEVVRRDAPCRSKCRRNRRMVLVTAHRRISARPSARSAGIRDLADRHEDRAFRIRCRPGCVQARARDHIRPCAHHLCPPLDYLPFVAAMKRAYLV